MKVREWTGRATIRLTCGDCMDGLKAAGANEWELAIVDPPYGIKRFQQGQPHARGKHGNKTAEWDHAPTCKYFLELMRASANQIIWGANNFTLPPSEYFCVWDKQQTVDNFASAELAWVSMGLKKPAKVFRYSIHKHNVGKDGWHPTEKPVALYRWLLSNYAKKGDRILDTHGGSMSIALACWDAGHDLDAWEMDEDYFDAACDRIDRHVAQGQFDL